MPEHYLFDRLVIIPLNFKIGYSAITLSGFDPGMAQEILDGDQVRIGVEKLGGHGMPKLMTRDP